MAKHSSTGRHRPENVPGTDAQQQREREAQEKAELAKLQEKLRKQGKIK